MSGDPRIHADGETSVERCFDVLSRSSLLVAGYRRLDPMVFFQTKGGLDISYWRHVWISIVRTKLDFSEADISKALNIDHDSVAYACHRVEDAIATSSLAEAEYEWLSDFIYQFVTRGRAGERALEEARLEEAAARKRRRAKA